MQDSKRPEKRKLLFEEEMLMDFPDVGSLQTTFVSTEEKHLQWLEDLKEKHRIQRMRLRDRHIAEYRKWKEDTTLCIDPGVVLPHMSSSAFEEQMHHSSLKVINGSAASEALKREGREFRHVLVGPEQLQDQTDREEGEISSQRSNILSAYSNVELAAEIGKMGVQLRKRMMNEKLEMRIFQASEKEMVHQFLLKSDPERYGAKGKDRSSSFSGASGHGIRPQAMGGRPNSYSVSPAIAGIGGVGLSSLYRQNTSDRSRPKQPLNIKIPQHEPTSRPGSRTVTPITGASTITMSGELSAGLTRDPRLSSKSDTAKTFRLPGDLPKNSAGGGGVRSLISPTMPPGGPPTPSAPLPSPSLNVTSTEKLVRTPVSTNVTPTTTGTSEPPIQKRKDSAKLPFVLSDTPPHGAAVGQSGSRDLNVGGGDRMDTTR